MKSLTKFVQEMYVNKIKRNKYKYFPKTKEELTSYLCDCIGVSKSGYYNYLKNENKRIERYNNATYKTRRK